MRPTVYDAAPGDVRSIVEAMISMVLPTHGAHDVSHVPVRHAGVRRLGVRGVFPEPDGPHDARATHGERAQAVAAESQP
jgi:hypothetical protein